MEKYIDEEQFEQVYNKYGKELYRIAYGYFHNTYTAENIVQNVFLKYLLYRKDFASTDHEHYWFIRVTINECNLEFRKNQKRLDNFGDDLSNYPALSAENDKEYLYYYVQMLPEKYKTVILLYYYNHYKTGEISSMLKVSKRTVFRLLDAAKAKLIEMMEENNER